MATDLLTAPLRTVAAPPGGRRVPWKSPDGQPGYARPALLGIAAVAAVLYAWNINHSQYHAFYADAVRSMTESWKAFLFGSFDPANTITLDKLPGFLWPQALCARLFGFHPWALTLPQAIEGVLAVLVMYRVVRRWAGANAGLLAAAAFTLTPVAAGLFRTAVEDAAFTLLLLLAADAAQRAAQSGRLRPLLLAGVWVGLAFQTKMLEAWAVLPALAAVYLVSAPVTLRRRFGHVALAGLVTVAVSASWMLAVTLTPAKDRPFVDGTTDNSAFSMVVGYNFLNRFSSVGLSASQTGSVQAVRGGGGGGNHGGGGHGGGYGAGGRGAGGHGGGQAGSGAGGAGFGAGFGAGHSGAAGASGMPGASDAPGMPGAPGDAGAAGHGGWRTEAQGGGGAGATGMAGAGADAGAFWAAAGGGGGGGMSDGGWTKMFNSQFAPQTGWFYPLALVSLVCGLVWRRRAPRTDVRRAGFVLWGTWLTVFFLVFSAGSVGGHSYYMGVIAAPLAALSGTGLVLMWRAFRDGGRRAWALPVAIASTVAWCAYLAWTYPTFLPWLAPTAIALGLLALVLLGLARTGGGERFAGLFGRRLALAGALTGIAAVLVAPSAWASSVLDSKYGNSGMGTVGPVGGGHGGGNQRSATSSEFARLMQAEQARFGGGQGGGFGGGFGGSSEHLSAPQQALFDYLQAHRDGARYLLATTNWSSASPFILATGAEVLPMGGFSGSAPAPSPSQFQQFVDSGQLRYVLLTGEGEMGGMGGVGGSANPATAQIQSWVRTACTVVSPGEYGATAQGTQQLYTCRPAR
ncbi:ArnT family glycosyltransferase [Kitasatospora sp. NPDC001175]|uniref:ArnT family glycosyltransferase n=1 Tax=Kitasatospora sp. NPDC001175 TaxID=3157103 RepID=UPI003CFC5AF6